MKFLELPSLEMYCANKWVDPLALEQKINMVKREDKTIATLNGSFDLLHVGHLQMLYEASLQADVLIILLNTDNSIKKYKSEKRPIIPLEQRAQMIASIGFVDYVTWFDELDPRAILEKIKPDVHVNGSEYGETCIESAVIKQYGGRLHIVPLVPGFSTSNLIKKIINACA